MIRIAPPAHGIVPRALRKQSTIAAGSRTSLAHGFVSRALRRQSAIAAHVRIQTYSRSFASSPDSTSNNKNDTSAVTTTESKSYLPISFETSSRIQGEESQILQVDLNPNQILRAESGAMLFMTQGVEMSTSLGSNSGDATGSAIKDGLKRMMTGQNMFLSDYTYNGKEGTTGTVALGTDFPSKILRFSLSDYDNKIICQKGALLASTIDVDIQMEFAKKFTTGFFGGEGFILQGLVGEGDVFIKGGGTIVKRELKEGETIRVSSGCLVAFTQDVEFDVQTMPGFKNVLFGGEGLFVTSLTGPGTVWLQGMPPDRMISEIARRVPSGGIGLGIPIGMGGGAGDGAAGAETTTEEGAEESDASEDPTGEELVASTDAAVDADRNATVASSGLYDDVDSESPSALFGDAAGDTETDIKPGDSSSSLPGLDDETSFSTEGTSDFGEDLTNNQQFDDFDTDDNSLQDEGSTPSDDFFNQEDKFETFNSDSSDNEVGDEEGGIGSILGQLWDFFNDD